MEIQATKPAIVINQAGLKVEFVAVLEDGTPFAYKLNEGEELIFDDTDIANTMHKPKWDNNRWVETATKVGIENLNIEEEKSLCPPSMLDLVVKEITLILNQIREEHNRAIAELTIAMAKTKGSV